MHAIQINFIIIIIIIIKCLHIVIYLDDILVLVHSK